MPYGTTTAVAALARVWTKDGEFTDETVYAEATCPTLAQVRAWIDNVSAAFDVALANEGFVVPVEQFEAEYSMALMVESIVADLCHAANSSGRFFTEKAIERGTSPMLVIRKELNEWVAQNAVGLENLGVQRSKPGRHVAKIDLI